MLTSRRLARPSGGQAEFLEMGRHFILDPPKHIAHEKNWNSN